MNHSFRLISSKEFKRKFECETFSEDFYYYNRHDVICLYFIYMCMYVMYVCMSTMSAMYFPRISILNSVFFHLRMASKHPSQSYMP